LNDYHSSFNFNLSSFANGIYSIEVISNQGVQCKRIVINK
jgi:hypothetical protein